MKLKFKVQPYQTSAVESVVDCFAGQVNASGIAYRIDPGLGRRVAPGQYRQAMTEAQGFKNADIQLNDAQLLSNIHAVQRRQNLTVSQAVDDFHVKDARRDCYVPAPAAYKKDAQKIGSIR